MKMNFQMLGLILLLFASPSCSNDDNSNQKEIQGTWQLTKFEDSTEGIVLDPSDGYPVQITFRANGSFDGKAGNNDVQGEYRLESGKLAFTLFGSEISNTEWELMFKRSINKSWEGNEYIMPYNLEGNEMTLNYETQSKMFFMRI